MDTFYIPNSQTQLQIKILEEKSGKDFIDLFSKDVHNLKMTVRKDGILRNNLQDQEQQELVNLLLKEESQLNKAESSITFKRNGLIDKAVSLKQQNQINDIEINFNMEHKHLNEEELKNIMITLRNNCMCISEYISSGGEADVYFGYLLDFSGNKVEAVFRIIKIKEKENLLQMREEYDKVNRIKQSRNIIEYEGLLQIGDHVLVFIMKKYESNLKVKLNKMLSFNEFWIILLDLIYGLMELRINNIIHSDIKPANILLNKECKCFYSDFGIAIQLKDKDKFTKQNFGYTPEYCSPEHLNGNPLSYASDMYSLGKVLMKLSEALQDPQSKQEVQKFIHEKILQEEQEKRILHENLLPQIFELITFNQIPLLIDYFLSIGEYSFKAPNDIQANVLANTKIKQSYKLVEINTYKAAMQMAEDPTKAQYNIIKLLIDLYCLSEYNFEEHQTYLEEAFQILDQLPKNDPLTQKIQLRINWELSNYFQKSQQHEKAIKSYEIVLKLLSVQLQNTPQVIIEVYPNIAQCYYQLNKLEEAIKYMKISIEQEKAIESKASINNLFLLGQYYEKKKDLAESQNCYQQVINTWQENKSLDQGQDNYEKYTRLECISQSLLKRKEMFQSYQVELQRLKLAEQLQLSKHQNEEIINIIYQLTQERRKIALDDLIKLENFDLTKKKVLQDFAEYYLFKEQKYEEGKKILQICESITEEMPMHKYIQFQACYGKYYQRTRKIKEATQCLRNGLELFRKSNLKMTRRLNQFQWYFIFLIMDQIHYELGENEEEERFIMTQSQFEEFLNQFNNVQMLQQSLQDQSEKSHENFEKAISKCFEVLLQEKEEEKEEEQEKEKEKQQEQQEEGEGSKENVIPY